MSVIIVCIFTCVTHGTLEHKGAIKMFVTHILTEQVTRWLKTAISLSECECVCV